MNAGMIDVLVAIGVVLAPIAYFMNRGRTVFTAFMLAV